MQRSYDSLSLSKLLSDKNLEEIQWHQHFEFMNNIAHTNILKRIGGNWSIQSKLVKHVPTFEIAHKMKYHNEWNDILADTCYVSPPSSHVPFSYINRNSPIQNQIQRIHSTTDEFISSKRSLRWLLLCTAEAGSEVFPIKL
mgnify:CR=1 FL=1